MDEAFLAYEHKLREDARHAYELEILLWLITAQASRKPPKKPKLPDILKDA